MKREGAMIYVFQPVTGAPALPHETGPLPLPSISWKTPTGCLKDCLVSRFWLETDGELSRVIEENLRDFTKMWGGRR